MLAVLSTPSACSVQIPAGINGKGYGPFVPCHSQDCTYGTEIIAKWKSLLENDQLLSHSGQDLSTDAFHR